LGAVASAKAAKTMAIIAEGADILAAKLQQPRDQRVEESPRRPFPGKNLKCLAMPQGIVTNGVILRGLGRKHAET
jgi:hypothetical protein